MVRYASRLASSHESVGAVIVRLRGGCVAPQAVKTTQQLTRHTRDKRDMLTYPPLKHCGDLIKLPKVQVTNGSSVALICPSLLFHAAFSSLFLSLYPHHSAFYTPVSLPCQGIKKECRVSGKSARKRGANYLPGYMNDRIRNHDAHWYNGK
jgi:hypothetical protein